MNRKVKILENDKKKLSQRIIIKKNAIKPSDEE